MKIKAYYNKTLNMSMGKIAAQVAHAVAGLYANMDVEYSPDDAVIVALEARQSKLESVMAGLPSMITCWHAQFDLGLTETPEGSLTAIAYVEEY